MAVRWVDLYNNIIDNATTERIPVSGFFELTPRCNFHCRMCYICSLPENKTVYENELTAAQWIHMGEEARNAGLLLLTLTGGEIFLRKDFWEIYDEFTNMGFNIVLFTNGSLLTAEKVKRLAKKPPSKVSITIYGASPETYGRVTGHPEGYESTLAAIRMLISEGIRVDLKTTVIRYNSDEFETLAELTRSMGITIGVVNYVSPRREGCGTEPEEVRLTPGELAAYEKRIMDYNLLTPRNKDAADNKVDHNGTDSMSNDDLERLHKGAFAEAAKHSAFKCISGKCGFWLTWDGKLTPCGLLNEPYSEPLKIGFGEAWKQLQKSCDSIPSCEDCKNCSYRSHCMACPARLKSETDSFVKPAPYLCEMAKSRKSLDIKY